MPGKSRLSVGEEGQTSEAKAKGPEQSACLHGRLERETGRFHFPHSPSLTPSSPVPSMIPLSLLPLKGLSPLSSLQFSLRNARKRVLSSQTLPCYSILCREELLVHTWPASPSRSRSHWQILSGEPTGTASSLQIGAWHGTCEELALALRREDEENLRI